MSDTIKGAIIGALITTVGSILIFFLGNFSTQSTIVERLTTYFEFIDSSMSYEQALQAVYEESKQKDEIIGKLNQQNTELQNQILSMPSLEIKNSALIYDGLKIDDAINKSVIIVDNNAFFSGNILDIILENHFSYDSEQNIIFYNTGRETTFTETKIDLFDTNVLYDGTCYGIYLPSDGKTFSMGSNTYNQGFVLYDDHSFFGEGDGFALFDLQGKYSKITFDVGRTNEHEKQDVTLKVYLNNEYIEEYSLNAQSPPVQIAIDLNYANHMKLEITGGSRVIYGFANVILHY